MPRGRPKGSGSKEPKKTPIKIEPVLRKHAGKITQPYKLMEDLIETKPCFEHLKIAKIKLWWQKDFKADVDGIAVGAQVCKASELDRNLKEENGSGETVDLFIKLPRVQWPTLDDEEKRHRMFHELCHIRPAMNSEGKQKEDTKGRLLWRLRRHPITAFHEEIEEFGMDRVIGHNETIVESLRTSDRPMERLFDAAEKVGGVTIEAGGKSVTIGKAAPATTEASDESEAAAANPSAWKRWKIDCLSRFALGPDGLPDGKLKLLEEAGLTTMGKLTTSINKAEEPGFWYKSVAGFGESGWDSLTTAMIELRKQKPAFQADEA